MDATKLSDGSATLSNLAQRLRLTKPPSVSRNNIHPGFIHDYTLLPSSRIKTAAVLICIFEGDGGDLRVILTKRSATLSSHSSAVALPGGKTEEGDADEVATALREAREEIGLDPSLIDIVAILESVIIKSGMLVVPVVGLLHDRNACRLTPNAAEVEEIFDVPLEMFLKNENRREVEFEWKGETSLIDFFDYNTDGRDYVIFGLTLAILIETALLVYQRPPAFLVKTHSFMKKISHGNL